LSYQLLPPPPPPSHIVAISASSVLETDYKVPDHWLTITNLLSYSFNNRLSYFSFISLLNVICINYMHINDETTKVPDLHFVLFVLYVGTYGKTSSFALEGKW
jgi:hypothetical protein